MKVFGIYQYSVFKKATTQEVIALLNRRIISLNTEIYSFSTKQWRYTGELFSGHIVEVSNSLVTPLITNKFSLLTNLNADLKIRGPLEMKDILFLIQSKKLAPFDLIFNPAVKQWVFANSLFMDFFVTTTNIIPEDTQICVDIVDTPCNDTTITLNHFWKQDSSVLPFSLTSIFNNNCEVASKNITEKQSDTSNNEVLLEIENFSKQIAPLKKALKKIHIKNNRDNKKLLKQNQQLVAELVSLKEDNKKIIEIVESLKKQVDENHHERKQDLIKNTQEIGSFKNSVDLIQKSIIKKEKEAREKQKAKELLEAQSKKSTEDEHLWFTISSAKEWLICENEDKVSRKYSFDEIHKLFHNGKLNNENLKIKQITKKLWKPLHSNDYIALELRVREDVSGEKIIELKRKSSRIPFEGKSTITTKEGQIIGNCVDIASGGCFIDIPKKQCEEFFKGQRISFQIDSKLADGIFNLEGEVVKINTGRVSGLQIKFLNKTEEFSADLDQIIKKYFFYLNKTAA